MKSKCDIYQMETKSKYWRILFCSDEGHFHEKGLWMKSQCPFWILLLLLSETDVYNWIHEFRVTSVWFEHSADSHAQSTITGLSGKVGNYWPCVRLFNVGPPGWGLDGGVVRTCSHPENPWDKTTFRSAVKASCCLDTTVCRNRLIVCAAFERKLD